METFEFIELQRTRLCDWLGIPLLPFHLGSELHYKSFLSLRRLAYVKFLATKERCPCLLVPELIGLEGKWVEVIYPDRSSLTFKVECSLGWMPQHIEVSPRHVVGGPPAYIPSGSKLTVL